MNEDRKIALYDTIQQVNAIDPVYYERHNVKRGLRNANGSGVIAGVTNISNVHGYVMSDEVKVPDEGHLTIRGYDIYDLIGDEGSERRFNFEEVAYLLLMGDLPTQSQLDDFIAAIDEQRELPDGFTATYILNDTPRDIMNLLQRCILFLYSQDPDAEARSLDHEVSTAISLISRLLRISVFSYYAVQCRHEGASMIMHRFVPGQSSAETFLSMLRPDRAFTPEEARMLDIMLCLHAEHGGGNNSTFTCRSLSSSDTDPYSAYAGAIGSLKGYKHGGANHKVRAMQAELKNQVANWENEDEVAAYLTKIVKKQAYDKTGRIYGMGHAVYTKSDPRAVVLKKFARDLAQGSDFEAEFKLLETVERLSPEILRDVRGISKDVCANVDMYSGFVYSMLGIPEELYTPLFACSRIAGWSAHRFEEIISGKRIVRPAYISTIKEARTYVPIDQR